MIRISFLFLFLCGIYLSFNRELFAYSVPSVGYLQDTVVKGKIRGDTLQLDTIQIKPQDVTAEDKFEQKKIAYKSIYFWGDTKDMVTLPHQGGLAVNLNKLYNKLSRKGRNSRKLQRKFEQEYELDLIREEWFPLTHEYTLLSGDSLSNFRIYYQPSLQWLRTHGRYEKVAYIQQCLDNYMDSVSIIHDLLRLPVGRALRP